MQKLKSLINDKVARNAGWIIGGNIVQKLLAFLVGVLTARYLGPSNYGLISYAAAYTTFLFSLATLGLNSIVIKNLLDKPEQQGTTMGTILVLQGMASLLSISIIYLVVSIVEYGETETITVVLLCSIGLFFQMLDTIKYWFRARLESKFAAIATTIAYVLASIYKIILLITERDVYWFAVATSVDYLCMALILYGTYFRRRGPSLRFSWSAAKELLRSSYHYILSGVMTAVFSATDRLMLKHMLSEAAVGYYGTAVSICNFWVFVLSAIIESLNPVIVQAHNQDRLVYERRNRQLYAIIFYCSVFVSLMMTVFAKGGIRLLYGVAYLPAAGSLRIVTWYVAFSFLSVARNVWVVCENRQRYLPLLYFGAAAMNVLLNALMIPVLGSEGAALASLLTQISLIFVFPMLIRELRPNVRLMLDAILFRGVR